MDNTTTENGNGKGALFGVIVVILLLVAGGLYLGFKNTAPETPTIPTETAAPTNAESFDQTSAAIEADLNNSDFQTIDEDVADVSAALAN